MVSTRWVLLACLAAAVLPALALYEDEAGRWDWFRTNIGEVRQATFPRPSSKLQKRKASFVATTEGAVAAVNVRTGGLLWRRVLAAADGTPDIQLLSDKLLLSLTAASGRLAAWNPEDGAALWNADLAAGYGGLVALQTGTDRTGAVTVAGVSAGAVPAVRLHTVNSDGAEAHAPVDLTLPDAFLRGLSQVPAGWSLPVAATPQGLLFVNPATHALAHWVRQTDTFLEASYADLLTSGPAVDVATVAFHGAHAHPNDTTLLLRVRADLAVVIGVELTGEPVVQHALALQAGDAVAIAPAEAPATGTLLLHARTGGSGTRVGVFSLAGVAAGTAVAVDTLRPEQTAAYADASLPLTGQVEFVALQPFVAKERNQPGYRALLRTEDATLGLLQNGKPVWRREEALSRLSAGVFSNLPLATRLAEAEDAMSQYNLVGNMIRRVASQAVSVTQSAVDFAGWLQSEVNRLLGVSEAAGGGVLEEDVAEGQNGGPAPVLTRDRFGFRKLIVGVTKDGAAVALHTTGGQVVWKRFLHYDFVQLALKGSKEYSSAAAEVEVRGQWLLEIKEGHHVHDHLLVWAAVRVAGAEHHCVLQLQCLTGSVEASRLYTARLVHAALLPYYFRLPGQGGTRFSHPLLLVDSDLAVHVFPEEPTAVAVVKEQASRIFFHLVGDEAVTGYVVSADGTGSRSVWQVGLDRNRGEEVVTVSHVGASPYDRLIQNTVKVKQGAAEGPDFLFKYTNPNTFVLATATPASNDPDRKSKTGPSVTLYLIDGVTGSVLQQMSHPHAVPPVRLLQVENYVVYHMLNVKQLRYQVGVWELLEDTATAQALPSVPQAMWLYLWGATREAQSALTALPPVVGRELVGYPTAVNCLAATSTLQGITNRWLLVGTAQDQILALDLQALHLNFAARQQEVLIDQRQVLSYNRTIHRLRSVVTAPSALESTSHVFGVGLDLFYTRVAPSRPYDLLNDDFSYLLLLLTTAGLGGLTVVTKWLARSNELSRAWA